jgi:hypothetical protein
MFKNLEELKMYLIERFDTTKEISAVASSETSEDLAKAIHEFVGTHDHDATAWLIEALCEDQYSQWGRIPEDL